jgi:hypothetical protein
MFCCVGEQSHKAGLFDGGAEAALVLGTGASLAAGLNFPAIRNEALHQAIHVFVVNFTDVLVAELTNFAARSALATFSAVPTWTAAGGRITFLHG